MDRHGHEKEFIMRSVRTLFALATGLVAGVSAASAQVAKNPEEAAKLGQTRDVGQTGASKVQSGAWSAEVKPIFNTWDEVMKRVEANKGPPIPHRSASSSPRGCATRTRR
jgi:hypothetical protein